MEKENIICFGEMLWDMLPTGKMPGGAPMNVAIHLKNFGYITSIISRVGTDDLGNELMDFVKEKGLNTNFIQHGQTHLTGVVKVNMDDKNNVSYKIVKPVAWDYILLENDALEAVKKSDCFVFGSLSARSEQTFDTLKKLLSIAKFKVLDINLRTPYYDKETIEFLLNNTDLLKLNHLEIDEISQWFFKPGTVEENLRLLSEIFKIKTICVTLGEEGALLLHENKIYRSAGYEVDVVDTIGSGDSFLASFISNILKNTPVDIALNEACAMGALVATYHGASPKISKQEIQNLMNKSLSKSNV
ncbi:carbohydrate kinase [Lacihabitans sp. LS3-19]|uniref:carbohydrate kinase family protein n=1 Tax=Lacihabitans sp. LS3-19 TaxID=2487335 RepID=UPI0020CCFAA0|nr:carbohydrate kinase [Lacihabitans sp. LS3-19]MCP9767256.1 carbohydrate kinase [Lacihabitans sp. LS3-19]